MSALEPAGLTDIKGSIIATLTIYKKACRTFYFIQPADSDNDYTANMTFIPKQDDLYTAANLNLQTSKVS